MRKKPKVKSSRSVLFPAYPLGLCLGGFFKLGKMCGAVRILHEERLACLPTTKNLLLTGNHRSWADPFIIAGLISKYFIRHPLEYAPIIFADRVLFFNSPIFGLFKSVMIPIDRGDDKSKKMASAKRMIQAMDDYPSRPKILFPEGGRTFKEEIAFGGNGRFLYGKNGDKTKIRILDGGIGFLAQAKQATVLPIGIFGSDMAFPNSKKQILTRLVVGEKIVISIGEPKKFDKSASREAVTQEIASLILEQLDEAFAFSNANP